MNFFRRRKRKIYRVDTVVYRVDEIIPRFEYFLNELSEQGWEVFQIIPSRYLFTVVSVRDEQ